MARLRNWSVSRSGAAMTLVGVDHDTGAKRRLVGVQQVSITPNGLMAHLGDGRQVELLAVFRHEQVA